MPERLSSATDQREDPPDHGHVVPLHLVAVPRLVVAKTVAGRVAADDLALPSLAEFPPSATLGSLRPLELGELVEDAVGEFALGAVIPAVVESAYLAAILLELTPEEVVVCGLARDAVPILGKHHGNAPGGHEIPHTVHSRTLQGRATVSGVYYLCEDLVAFSGSVGSQGFELLG